MLGFMRRNKGFRRGAVLPAALAWMGLMGMSMALMQVQCPLLPGADSDGDGVSDRVDLCPDTPEGETVDADGCAESQLDDDSDGVMNDADLCPDTPAGETVDADGCSDGQLDDDADGVANADDLCPDTPAGEAVDADGCAASQLFSVNAGADQTVDGGDTATLTALTANAVSPVTFGWEITANGDAGSATLVGAASQTLTVSFSEDASGTFTFQVTASDASGATAQDSVDVVATPAASTADTTFTIDTDDLTGTAGDDTFDATMEYNELANAWLETLNTPDVADGLGGNDTIRVGLNGENPAPDLSNIETVEIVAVRAASTLNFASITGVTAVEAGNNFAGALTLSNIPAIFDLSVNNSDQSVTLTFAASLDLDGTTDAINLEASKVTAGTWTIPDIELATLNSTGSTANVIANLTMAALTELTVTGDQDLEITNAIAATTFDTLDASGLSGGLTLLFPNADSDAISITGGSGDDTITAGTAGDDVTASMGAGDDTLTLGGLTADADSVDGGDGEDTLVLPSATIVAWADEVDDVTNVETVEASDALAGDVDLATAFPGGMNLTLAAGINNGADRDITVLSGTTITKEADVAAGAATVHDIIITGDAIDDTLSINLDNAGLPEPVDLEGVEVCNLDVDGGAATIADLEMNPSDPAGPAIGDTLLTITGDQNLTITTLDVETVDASAFTGDLAATAAAQVDMTGGTGDDTLTGSAADDAIDGGAGGDTIDGAAGDDDIAGGTGDDIITGGAGADLIDAGSGDDDITGGAGGDVITAGAGADSIDYNTATDSLNTALDELQDFTSGTDLLDVATVPTTSGSGTGGADLNTGTTASTGSTAGTLATDIATVVAAAAANAFDQAGDVLVITITGTSVGGSNAVYVVIEDGTSLTTYDAAEDTVILLDGTSSTTLDLDDFE